MLGESAAEAHVDDVVPLIFGAVARKKRRFYIPGRFRAVPVIKHAPLPRILERLVWRKARL
ncbi:hypothetical protein DIPPA_23466 [Diplonema papillatum]|nr:hypothetical protein DIPPA_23466 [Diplonema papillatum]